MESEYKDCYIAFLDLLGFKNLISQKTCADIRKVYEKIDNPFGEMTDGDGVHVMNAEEIKMKVMSDSICFYVDATIQNALIGLLALCTVFQAELLNMEEPVLMRGAIVRGKIYAENDIMFGPGLTAAYLMEEKNAQYPRIILTKQVLDYEQTPIMKKYVSVFTYRDTDAFWTINCYKAKRGSHSTEMEWGHIRTYVSDVLNATTDSSIREKYLYLEKQINKYTKNEGQPNA